MKSQKERLKELLSDSTPIRGTVLAVTATQIQVSTSCGVTSFPRIAGVKVGDMVTIQEGRIVPSASKSADIYYV
jgi:hypothetical protein